jgi:hypothetical protein
LSTSHDPDGPIEAPARCALAGWAFTSVPVAALPELRKQPGPVCGKPLAANFCKHADEQTVAGLAAVFGAIHEHRLAPDGSTAVFRDWGVVGAPRFLGHAAMACSLPRFLAEGAWDVSPHMIPHRSLHATSGTISQALKIHGPNFGVGGGPGCEGEALLAAVALLCGLRLPGVWLVFTRVDPELPEDRSGKPVAGTFCQGLALALRPIEAGVGVELELAFTPSAQAVPALSLKSLLGMLDQLGRRPLASQPIAGGGRLTFRRTATLSGPHFPLTSCNTSPSSPTADPATEKCS